MKKVSVALLGAMCLMMGACSSESDDSERTTTQQEEQSSEHNMGEMVKGEGVSMKVEKAYTSNKYSQRSMEDSDQNEIVKPREKAKFIILETVVQNDSDEAIDPVCGNGFSTKLVTDKDKKYGTVENLFAISPNETCEDVDPEFDKKVKLVYEIPASSKPETLTFYNNAVDSFGDRPTSIKLDKLSDKAPSTSESKGPKPTSASSASDEATDTAHADSSVATTVEQDTSADSAQSAAAPVSGSPAYGNPCSPSQALQPAVGADGTNLVCVLHTPTEGNWVYGPAPSGETVSSGQECTEGEQGGQDEQDRLLMCVNGNWVYGP